MASVTTSLPPLLPGVSPEQAAAELLRRRRARTALLDFTLYTKPDYTPSWHHEALCAELDAFARGETLRLMVFLAPQRGKTELCSRRLPAYLLGRNPDCRVIGTSYGADLASSINRDVQRIMDTDAYRRLFPDAQLFDKRRHEGGWLRNSEEFEIVSRRGFYKSAGVGGGIAGRPGDVLLIDDVCKDRKEADSPAYQEMVKGWYEGVLYGRRSSERAQILLVMTRWNESDLAGYLLERQQADPKLIPWRVVRFPELAEDDGPDTKPWERRHERDQRQEGEPLWPERYGLEDCLNTRATVGSYTWASVYQQRPAPRSGGMFKREWFTRVVNATPVAARRVRYWDKAGTEGGGKRTCGVLMAKGTEGLYYVEDVITGQWSSGQRNAVILQTAERDAERYKNTVQVWAEQEPGPMWEEELVQMSDGGRRKLKDVIEGDWVINSHGQPTRVIGSFAKGLLPTLRIETDSGRIVHAAFDHPFLTPRGWIRADNLEVSEQLALPAGVETQGTSSPTTEECRLAGYFVGDGCCTLGKNGSPNANVVCSDRSQGDDIRHCAEACGFSVNLGGSKGWTYNLSGGVRDWLWSRGLAGKGTADKMVPDWVMAGSRESVAHFLGAYFACDGSVSVGRHGTRVEFYSTNRALLEQTSSLLLRFGIYGRLRQRHYKPEFQAPRRAMYRITLARSDDAVGRFADQIPVFGKKAEVLAKCGHGGFDRPLIPDLIVKIESAGQLPCRCLTVGDGHSFLVNDIAVHNSGGKESAENTIRELAGYPVHVERPTGDKAVRAEPFSAQCEAMNVILIRAPWNESFVQELCSFPMGKFSDQVDASSGAFNKLALATTPGRPAAGQQRPAGYSYQPR